MRPHALVSIAVLLVSPAASAQAPAAEALFQQGQAALAAGDLDAACARFRESDRLDPTAGRRANLAECEQKRGHVASAWEAFRVALGRLPRGDERGPKIEKRIAELEPRLPRLVLSLAPGAPADTTVKDDDVVLGAGAFGVPLPVDPGPRRIVASAPSHEARTYDANLAEGETFTLAVEPGGIVGAAAPAGPVPTAPAPANGGSSAGPWIVGGVGAAALVAGIVTGILVLQDASATSGCNNSPAHPTCAQPGVDAANQGRTLGPVTTVLLVAGGAGLAAGGIWLGVRSGKATARFGVGPVAGGAAWRLEGSW